MYRAGARAVDLGVPSVYQGGQNLSTKAAVLKRESLLIGGTRPPLMPALDIYLYFPQFSEPYDEQGESHLRTIPSSKRSLIFFFFFAHISVFPVPRNVHEMSMGIQSSNHNFVRNFVLHIP